MKLFKPVVRAITFSGSAQRVVTPAAGENADLRFVAWASIEALSTNSNRMYIGDSNVSSTLYSTSLAANEAAQLGGPEYGALGGPMHGKIDLSKVYVLGTSSEKALLTIFVPDEG